MCGFDGSRRGDYFGGFCMRLPVPVFMYDTETMIWKEEERSRIRHSQMDNLRGLVAIRRIDEAQNAQIREGMEFERID